MALLIDKDLLFWIEAEMHEVILIHDPDADEEKLKRATLQEFAERGFAKRYVDDQGRVAWRSTEKMDHYLEEQELSEFFVD